MNAAERLWRGLARHDWEAVRAQFHGSAVVVRPATHERLRVEEFVALHRADAARATHDVEVVRSVADGKTCVIEATIGDNRCAGLYDLHEGRIAGATEYWTS